VKNVADVVKMGDVVKVKVLSVDVEGKRLALSRKGLTPRPAAAAGGAAAADKVEEGE
jgi:ribosomal protein S1